MPQPSPAAAKRVPASDNNPILSRVKSLTRKLDNSILTSRAKRVMEKHAKQQRDKFHIDNPNQNSSPAHEKHLRKIGTRGVVVLFNAIRHAQKTDSLDPQQLAPADASSTKDTLPPALLAKRKRILQDNLERDDVKIRKASFKNMISVQQQQRKLLDSSKSLKTESAGGAGDGDDDAVDWIRDDYVEIEAAKQSTIKAWDEDD
ncbi:MAG: hypothetical protein SGCHY_003573 [Lobulomycetales sp.]